MVIRSHRDLKWGTVPESEWVASLECMAREAKV